MYELKFSLNFPRQLKGLPSVMVEMMTGENCNNRKMIIEKEHLLNHTQKYYKPHSDLFFDHLWISSDHSILHV